MGSNAINLVNEDLCCPVCRKPLSSPGTPPKPKLPKLGRGKGRAPHLYNNIHSEREKRMAVGKFKDNEEIVIAQCGHLFHKFCLRHYCYLVREGRSNPMSKVSCPLCHRNISMSSQTIDYSAHQDKPNIKDKDFTKTSIMNNELSGQMMNVEQKLQKLEEVIEDGNHNFHIYRSHWRKLRKELKYIKRKRVEIEHLYSEIERAEQMLKCMQSQQLKIVKKFILKVKEKVPKDFIHFPRRLAPFLELIIKDDRLVRDLGEIIVPIHLNHLKSDRHSLLKGIITTVQAKLIAEGKTIEMPVATPDQVHRKAHGDLPRKPSIFVEVRKSSISILSSGNLTRESIRQIIETVDIPFRESKKLAANKRKVHIKETTTHSNVSSVSTTDIQVLYMPKRNVEEPASEPSRIVEVADSFVQVPVRRCKSTDAILEKSKKKNGMSTYRKGPANKSTTVKEKRSNTAVVIMSTKEVESGSARKELSSSHDEPSSIVESEHLRQVVLIKLDDKEAEDEANNNVSNSLTYRADHNGNMYSENAQHEVSKPQSPTEAPKETVSLLKLIYDNLEEERKSCANIIQMENSKWTSYNKNNYNDDASESNVIQPPPQLFRIDGRGIARPESPQVGQFRQPTFLSACTNSEKSTFVVGRYLPDEENQLDALSSDDKLLIASEHEAVLSARRVYGASARRPIFHGVPACMGMPEGKHNLQLPSEPQQHVPFYMKKWQQQLSSRKVLKRRLANVPLKSTRLVHSPKCDGATYYNSVNSNRQHAASTYQRDSEMEKVSPTPAIHLPPLSMYPVKRPPTPQSGKLPENIHFNEGPEREISRIYDYSSVWK